MEKMCAVGKKILKDGKEVFVCDETRTQLLPFLQRIQDEKGCISDEDMQEIANVMGIHPVEVYSVVTFYSFLSTEKKGKNIIRVSNCMPAELKKSKALMKEFEKKLGVECGETTKDGLFTLEWTGCLGMCEYSPAIMVNDKLIGSVKLSDVKSIIKKVDKLKNDISKTNKSKVKGPIIFSDIEKYSSLKKAVSIGPGKVIEKVKNSNLRGRGGAGFPTGLKWEFTKSEQEEIKYVVCNADEGEPGTFKDRILLTKYSELLFEGMVIAGYAIGAQEGIVYLRGEYRSLFDKLNKKLKQMKKDNVLGENIMGKKGFDFDIRICLGEGAYVCGEETALIESLEGYRGEPRNRPPFPVNTGFNGHPTSVNNVETFITVVHILDKGAGAFKSIGTEKSAGSKLLSISGDCKKPGVYEVPFGTEVKDILTMVKAKNTKAVQVGGASGTCVLKKDFDRKISFEDLSTGGSIIIFNKKRNMLDAARNFLEFFKEESCGQCTPCREGIPVLLESLAKIEQGKLKSKDDLYFIKSLCETMQIASKCGLGQTSSNAFLDIINIERRA